MLTSKEKEVNHLQRSWKDFKKIDKFKNLEFCCLSQLVMLYQLVKIQRTTNMPIALYNL